MKNPKQFDIFKKSTLRKNSAQFWSAQSFDPRKQCASTKFPQQEITWNFGTLGSEKSFLIDTQHRVVLGKLYVSTKFTHQEIRSNYDIYAVN